MIPFFKQVFTEEMKQAALNALENERFVLGESVFKFEEEFAKYCGTKHACAVNSGTSALKIALRAAGLQDGNQILTTPMSFIATSNSILFAGGKPAFSDINPQTGLLEATDLPPSTEAKGLLPVHLYGQPCEMNALKDYAQDKGLFLIEDACQAHGATYHGKKTGSLGDAGCFSFYAAKNMTVGGDGGMIVTDNEEILEKAKILRDCGRLTKYEHSLVGDTNRLNTVNCAIGLIQLKNLDDWTNKRRHFAELYRKNLPAEILLDKISEADSAYHLFVIKSDQKKEIQKKLTDSKIAFGIHYPLPIHLQPIYKQMFGFKGGEFPLSEEFASKILSLPMHPYLKDEEVLSVCEKINEVFP